MTQTLEQLYGEHSGKVSDKWSSYLETYDEILGALRSKDIRLLEIGIQNGGSLEVWAQYFPRATSLVGCDIDEKCRDLRYGDSRIKIVIGDATQPQVAAEILETTSTFDLILDDGSHRSGDIVATFARYFDHLAEGGTYVAEDLHCSYWEKFQGGLFDPNSSINFFKTLADIIHFEHWGVQSNRKAILKNFSEAYQCDFSEASLDSIFSIEFRNSMCIIKKRHASASLLGARIIAGEHAQVFPFVLDLKDTPLSAVYATDETLNQWSQLHNAPFVELQSLRKQNADQLAASSANRVAYQLLLEQRDDLEVVLNQTQQRLAINQRALDAFGRLANASNRLNFLAELKHESSLRLIAALEERLRALFASRSWRVTKPLRLMATYFRAWTRIANSKNVMKNSAASFTNPGTDKDASENQLALKEFNSPHGKILIVWFWENEGSAQLQQAIKSLERQIDKNWRVIFVAREELINSDPMNPNDSRFSIKTKLATTDIDAEGHLAIIDRAGKLNPHATLILAAIAPSKNTVVRLGNDASTGQVILCPATPVVTRALVGMSDEGLTRFDSLGDFIFRDNMQLHQLPIEIFSSTPEEDQNPNADL